MTGARMTKGARIGLILVGVPVALACVVGALIAVPAWILLMLRTTYDEPAPTPPLASLHVTRKDGRATEIHATLAAGCALEASVNLRVFDGFEPYMKPEAAERRLGPPTGRWKVPSPAAPRFEGLFGSRHSDELAPYYDRPEGRVTLRPFPTPEQGTNWVPVAYPKSCTLEYLFPDVRLRSQLAEVLPTDALASLNVHGSDGWGALIVSLNRSGCQDLELESRGPR